MYDRSTSHLVPLGDLCATFGIQSGSELLRVLGDLKLTEKVSLEEGWGGEEVRGLQTREEGGVMEAGSVVRAGSSEVLDATRTGADLVACFSRRILERRSFDLRSATSCFGPEQECRISYLDESVRPSLVLFLRFYPSHSPRSAPVKAKAPPKKKLKTVEEEVRPFLRFIWELF